MSYNRKNGQSAVDYEHAWFCCRFSIGLSNCLQYWSHYRQEITDKPMTCTIDNIRRGILLTISALSLAACTGSLVLGTAYNAAAKKTADRVKTYAEFDTAQKQWIEQSFQSFQQWHRISELPAYSSLMTDVANSLQAEHPVTKTQLDNWFDTIQQRGQRARVCSPLSGSAGFLSEMTGWQIDQLEKKLKQNRLEQYKKYQDESTEDRQQRRRELMITWASRAGVKMTDEQKSLLDKTLSQQTSMGDRRFQLWDDWTSQFITLLEARDSAQFPDRLRSHIDSLWNMTEKNYPQEWRQNQDLWRNFTHALLNDLSVDQKNALVGKITSIAKSTSTLSKKTSRATPVCYNEVG